MHKKFTLSLVFLCLFWSVFAQTQSPVYLSQTIGNSRGFYQYLPADYASSGKNYPLIIWVHGAGQVGNGNTADLPKVLELGLPNVISKNQFPSSFNVKDTDYSFIIISPQFISWPSGNNLGAMLTYVQNNYRVDPNRIYLMGMSAGGGAVWEFASASVANSDKLAAIIPFCGTLAPTTTLANRMAASKLPIWAFHNTNDGTVPVAYSRNWKNYFNAYSPVPSPLAKLTEFPVGGTNAVILHDCWTATTVPTYKPEGINLYEWLLQYKRRLIIPNVPPVASAGDDASLVLPGTFTLNGALSNDPDGVILSYRWRQTAGPASFTISDTTAIQPVVSNLTQGIYTFRLTVTDNSGAVSTDDMSLSVYNAAAPGAQQRVLIDVGSSNITTNPSINGNVWNNMTDARPGVRITNALTTNSAPSGIAVEVINRIDGTYSTGSNGMGNGNTVGIVSDYPANATTDHALIHSSATNGRWRIKGMLAANTYTIKFWGARSNTTAARTADIKRADESVWKSYTATNNTNYNNAAIFIITGKTEMDFDIRTNANSDFSALNVIDITYTSGDAPEPVNLAPVAKAGADTTIQLPKDSTILLGCNSLDPEASPLRYKWRKYSGPASFQVSNDTLCAPKLTGLVAGTYGFELTVTDNQGLAGKDSVLVTVNNIVPTNWPPQVSPLCNKPYKIVVVGSSTAYGTGASPIDSSWVKKFTTYVQIQNPLVSVVNIATLSLTSYDVSPTGTPVPSPYLIDTARNITKALSLNPDAIILSLPSNDVARGIPAADIHTNFNRIVAAATARQIPVWVTTTQARNTLSAAERVLQMELRDWIINTYGNKAVDFWSTISNADGTINEFYSAGDGVHLNNYGHHVLFTRIVAEKIWDSLCARKNQAPIANAGRDTSVSPNTGLVLSATGSSDPDGDVITYNWRVVNSSNATITSANTASPVFTATAAGLFRVELKVTDTYGKTAYDTVAIQVSPVNVPPVAYAGIDQLVVLPLNTVTLNGSTSSDPDGNHLTYHWLKIAGNNIPAFNDSIAVTTISGLTAGTYSFRLTVTDDSTAIDMDTVVVTVNSVPVAVAGTDIYLAYPVNSTLLNGLMSNDADGNNIQFKWRVLTRAPGTALVTSDSATTIFTVTQKGTYTVELKVTDVHGSFSFDTVKIIVAAPNLAPVASVVKNILIHLPTNSAQLNGSASADPDGIITQYQWSKISGGAATIANSTSAVTTVENLVAGNYRFELLVRDDSSAIDRDTVFITVNAPPVANAGNDVSITLPVNTTTLHAESSDSDGTIVSYRWRKISGATMSFSDTTSATTAVTLSTAGTYRVQLLVTDNLGAVSSDTVQLVLNPDPNRPPVANAGAGTTLQLPANKTLLDGRSSTDPDGDVLTYQWSYVSGPAGYNLGTAAKDTTSATLPNAGTYVFRLTVIDVRGLTSSAQVTINVLPVPELTKKIKVNLFGGTNPYVNTQWNNWNVTSNLTSSAFTYENATASSITANISASALVADNGTPYAAAATSCPPAVLRYTSANTSYRLLVISGLDRNKKYDFEFYGSRANTGNSSVYQIGNKFDTIETSNNLNDKASFSQIVPDNTGKVTVTISRIGTWNYLSGFMITEYPVASPAFARGNASGSIEEESMIAAAAETAATLVLHPNPVQDRVVATFPGKFVGAYSLTILDANGRIINTVKGIKAAGALNRELNIASLRKGIYILRLSGSDLHISTKLIKL